MNRFALIVAGGKGLRMGAEIPKQFLMLHELPVLMHTLKAFSDYKIILVLPQDQFDFWKFICQKHQFTLEHKLVAGGKTRFESVQNGLQAIADPQALVAIHDGVRPIISREIIENSFKVAEEKGNAIAVVSLKDSLRKQELIGNHGVNRANYYLVQTPQTFQAQLIKEAYLNSTHDNFTDDAGVLEETGVQINLIEGDYRNIKITTPDDLLVASVFLKS